MAIFTAIAAAVGAVGTFIGGLGAVGSFLLNTAVGVGLNLLAQAIAGKPKSPASASFGINGTLQAGGDVPRSFIPGRSATAGSLVWVNTWGQDGETPNAYLTQVIAIADLPGHLLEGVLVNGEQVTFGGTPHSQLGYPVIQYRKGGTDHLWLKWYDGTQTTADDFLVSTASNTNRQWESTRVGRGVTYVIATARISQNMFSGIPSFKFVVSGPKLYDPSKDSTVPGGSGSHRWNNPATWGGDGDHLPAVQIYNLLRGFNYNGEWFYGLQGVTGARLPTADWVTQINKCRADDTYRAGGEITVDVPLATAIEALLTACQGRLSEVGGCYTIHVGEPDEPVASFGDGDILSTEGQSFTPFFGLSDTINGIAATYPSPEDGWTEKAAPSLYRSDLEVLAGNRRLMADVTLSFVPYPEQVQRLMKSALAEGQRARRHTLVLPPEYWPFAVPGATLSWTSARNGYVDKWFRVDGAVDRANLDVMVDLTEVDPEDYDWDSENDFQPPVDGALGTLRPAPQPLVGWQVFPATIGPPEKRMPSIRVSFPGALEDVRAVRVQVRLAGETAPFFDGEIPYGDPSTNDNPSSVILAGTFAPNSDHEVQGLLIPFSSRETEWSEWLPVTTPDVWISELDAQTRMEIGLATAKATVQGSVEERLQMVFQELQALGQAQLVHRQVTDGTYADVRTEIQKRTSLQEAFASYKVTTDAVLNDPVTGLPATATSVLDLKSRVTANEGSITSILASAGLKVEVDGPYGVVTGAVQIDGTALASIIMLLSDKLVIAKPNRTGAKQIFTTGTVDGVNDVIVLNADLLLPDNAVKAKHMQVITLDAISGNVGVLTAGKLRDPDNTYEFRLADGWWGKIDGSSFIDMKNGVWQFTV